MAVLMAVFLSQQFNGLRLEKTSQELLLPSSREPRDEHTSYISVSQGADRVASVMSPTQNINGPKAFN